MNMIGLENDCIVESREIFFRNSAKMIMDRTDETAAEMHQDAISRGEDGILRLFARPLCTLVPRYTVSEFLSRSITMPAHTHTFVGFKCPTRILDWISFVFVVINSSLVTLFTSSALLYCIRNPNIRIFLPIQKILPFSMFCYFSDFFFFSYTL